MFQRTGAFLAVVAMLMPMVAYGTGWDWKEEPMFRAWSTAQAQWVADVDPANHDAQWYIDNWTNAAPPREMWCVSGVDPVIDGNVDDCDILQDKITAWIDANITSPNTGINFPHECTPSSTCDIGS